MAANIAATAGQDAVVLCTIEAVWLGTEGGTEGVASPGLPALEATCSASSSTTAGRCGCAARARSRAASARSVLAKGATIVGAAKVVEEVVAGARTVAFAG